MQRDGKGGTYLFMHKTISILLSVYHCVCIKPDSVCAVDFLGKLHWYNLRRNDMEVYLLVQCKV
jgi:hypothetical protein